MRGRSGLPFGTKEDKKIGRLAENAASRFFFGDSIAFRLIFTVFRRFCHPYVTNRPQIFGQKQSPLQAARFSLTNRRDSISIQSKNIHSAAPLVRPVCPFKVPKSGFRQAVGEIVAGDDPLLVRMTWLAGQGDRCRSGGIEGTGPNVINPVTSFPR